jgi:hypothetical protein
MYIYIRYYYTSIKKELLHVRTLTGDVIASPGTMRYLLHVFIYVYVHVYVCIYTYICIYIYIYTYNFNRFDSTLLTFFCYH